jgi:hypothetical protein
MDAKLGQPGSVSVPLTLTTSFTAARQCCGTGVDGDGSKTQCQYGEDTQSYGQKSTRIAHGSLFPIRGRDCRYCSYSAS